MTRSQRLGVLEEDRTAGHQMRTTGGGGRGERAWWLGDRQSQGRGLLSGWGHEHI